MEKYSRIKALISLDAVLYNFEQMKKSIKEGTKIIAVIKADAYGHGAVPISRMLEELDYVWGFATATAQEALQLRRAGITKPILILGLVFEEYYKELVENDVRMAVCDYDTAKKYDEAAARAGKKGLIHIAADTGMTRIGFKDSEESLEDIRRIAALPNVEIEGLFTHFARADEKDKTGAHKQLELFQKMIAMCKEEGVIFRHAHCSNSAGIIDLPEANMDIVRAGITLYGLWPSDEVQKDRLPMHPLMELKSHVSYVKTLPAGREISYGGTYTTTRETKVATIPVGYGDGYPRTLSNKGSVLIQGKRVPILGRVCMDQFMVDVTDVPDVVVGTEVTLLGRDGDEIITAEEIGDLSGRFNYEFVCCLGKRIPRIYFENNKEVEQKDYFQD